MSFSAAILRQPRLWLAVAATMGFLTAGLAVAPPASAHTELVSSLPADGATLTATPGDVVLTFNETISPDFAVVLLKGPDASQVALETSVEGQRVIASIPGHDAAGEVPGRWVVAYRVVSGDGHPVTGKVTFTIKAESGSSALPSAGSTGGDQIASGPAVEAPPAAAPEDASTSSDRPSLTWPIVLAGALVVYIAAAALLRARKRRR